MNAVKKLGHVEQVRISQINEAISEAQRFLKRATSARKAIAGGDANLWRCPEYAAAKRASLDLSLALLSLRKRAEDDEERW